MQWERFRKESPCKDGFMDTGVAIVRTYKDIYLSLSIVCVCVCVCVNRGLFSHGSTAYGELSTII